MPRVRTSKERKPTLTMREFIPKVKSFVEEVCDYIECDPNNFCSVDCREGCFGANAKKILEAIG